MLTTSYILSKMAYGTSDTSPSTHSRDTKFNASSPESSSGAAESFKGTPDTRMTSFSPNNISARSAKAPASLSIITNGATPIKFAMAVAGSTAYERDNGSTTSSNDQYGVNLKDPFISTIAAKAGPKLSPTASSFFPNQPTQVQAAGLIQLPSRSLPLPTPLPQSMSTFSRSSAASVKLLALQNGDYVHTNLSTETGLSRCLVVSKQGVSIKADEVQAYVAVSDFALISHSLFS